LKRHRNSFVDRLLGKQDKSEIWFDHNFDKEYIRISIFGHFGIDIDIYDVDMAVYQLMVAALPGDSMLHNIVQIRQTQPKELKNLSMAHLKIYHEWQNFLIKNTKVSVDTYDWNQLKQAFGAK